MASKLQSLINSSDRMGFIDYSRTYGSKEKESDKEFLRGDMWEFKMTSPPAIVYYPGDDLMNYRLNQVNLGIDTSVSGFEKRMRGNYVIFQRTGQQTSGQITLQFTDREDQAISYFVDDWRQKIADRDTKYSFRKSDLVASVCELFITNAQRVDVRHLTFYNCIIRDAGLDENGSAEDGTDRAEVPLTMDFEHYERKYENLA